MRKVAHFIGHYAGGAFLEQSQRNRQSFDLLLGALSCEAERLIPDTESFQQRAEDLLILLAPSASATSVEGAASRTPAFGSAAVLAD